MTWGPDRVGCSVFLNNRFMDPATGMFISVDPLVGKTGTPYLYAAGNPTTLSDPSGLAACADEDNCGFAGSGTGRTSQLTAKQMSNLEANDGAAWVVQNIDTIWNVCQTDWTTCRDRVHNPGKTWDLNDSMDASMYEAFRMVYRTMLAYQRAGVGKVVGQFNGGGHFTSADGNELSLDVADAGWNHGNWLLKARWTSHDVGWFDGCGWSCAIVTGVTGIVAAGLAGAACAAGTVGTGGVGSPAICGGAATAAISITGLAFEASSNPGMDGGDVMCTLAFGPSNPAANAISMVTSVGAAGVIRGGSDAIQELGQELGLQVLQSSGALC